MSPRCSYADSEVQAITGWSANSECKTRVCFLIYFWFEVVFDERIKSRENTGYNHALGYAKIKHTSIMRREDNISTNSPLSLQIDQDFRNGPFSHTNTHKTTVAACYIAQNKVKSIQIVSELALFRTENKSINISMMNKTPAHRFTTVYVEVT